MAICTTTLVYTMANNTVFRAALYCEPLSAATAPLPRDTFYGEYEEALAWGDAQVATYREVFDLTNHFVYCGVAAA